jgi:septum formation protein
MIEQLGISYVVFAPDVDESTGLEESPTHYVERIARKKMAAALAASASSQIRCKAVLTADTVVVLGTRILGKPATPDESLAMISDLSGKAHEVISCYCLRDVGSGATRLRRVSTEVIFRSISREEMNDYVTTGEGNDKAGAYAIQGRAAAFVRSIRGSYSNVVGLPLAELVEDLREFGILGAQS